MFLGDVLVAHGYVLAGDVTAALERQVLHGGRLGDNLVSLGRLTSEQLEHALNAVPASPRGIEDTGLELTALLDLAVKAMHSGTIDTASKLAELVKLPTRLIIDLIREAELRQLVETQSGLGASLGAELRYVLTTKGRQWAQNAFEQNSYIGPAPVSLDAYVSRIRRQRIGGERVPPEAVRTALADLTMSDQLIAQVGPAINSGHSILLYGPPGNGKSSVAERIGRIFQDIIYIPHCFTVGEQIIRVFDPSIHQAIPSATDGAAPIRANNIMRDDFDQRWVACRRPCVMTGGELTLEMLDLNFNPMARFYEAPLHVKALNGIFLIDDFGRQIVSPEALLNRWIVPLASRVDYLKLHTGKSFSLPFDELVIFSTNLSPSDLMDPAFLRRIPYKIEIGAPDHAVYCDIFRRTAHARGLQISDALIGHVIIALTEHNDFPLASYQPGFLIDQIVSTCKFLGEPVILRKDLIDLAIGNLYTKDSPGYGVMRIAAKAPHLVQAVAAGSERPAADRIVANLLAPEARARTASLSVQAGA